MVCSKNPENISIKMDDDALKQVPKFRYLGRVFTEDGQNKEDLIQRIKKLKLCLILKSSYSIRITLVWK
jgi:hypothetical protein